MPFSPFWTDEEEARQERERQYLAEVLQRLLGEKQRPSADQYKSYGDFFSNAQAGSAEVGGFQVDNPWEWALASTKGRDRNRVLEAMFSYMNSKGLSGDYLGSQVNDPILGMEAQAKFAAKDKVLGVLDNLGFLGSGPNGARGPSQNVPFNPSDTGEEGDRPPSLQDFLAMIGGGAGQGGGQTRVALPRMSGPSDQEIAAMVNNLVTAASAPYDAARGNLDASKAAGQVEIAKASNDAQAAVGQNNAKFDQESTAALAALQARLQAGNQEAKATTDRVGQMLQAYGGNANVAQGIGQAMQQSIAGIGANQETYAQNQRILGQESGRNAANTAAQIGANGNINLLNMYGQMLSNLEGRKSQAVAQATQQGQMWGQERRDRANEFNMQAASREAEMNRSEYRDPLDVFGKQLSAYKAYLDLSGQGAEQDDEWDWSTLGEESKRYAARGMDGQTALQILDAERQDYINNNDQIDPNRMNWYADRDREITQSWERYVNSRRRRRSSSTTYSGAR